jgi:hypothetical protein
MDKIDDTHINLQNEAMGNLKLCLNLTWRTIDSKTTGNASYLLFNKLFSCLIPLFYWNKE